jgi:hypothetical protein
MSKMTVLACWIVVLVIVLLTLALAALPIALLGRQTWEVIYPGLLAVIVIPMGAYLVLAMTLRWFFLSTSVTLLRSD